MYTLAIQHMQVIPPNSHRCSLLPIPICQHIHGLYFQVQSVNKPVLNSTSVITKPQVPYKSD